jgi:dihydroorotate dehydrogenase electron transfer subunit
MKNEQPLMLSIQKVIAESVNTKTLVFQHKLNSKPGQFVMVWIPRLDEKPYSVAYQDNNKFAITVTEYGPFSAKLNELKIGDRIGIRGPYGNGFSEEGDSFVLVGGGCGCAPLAFLANELVNKGKDVIFIQGANSVNNLLYTKRLKKAGIKTIYATLDGSYGFKGFPTDSLKRLLKEKKVDVVCTCGPEIMMKKVIEICDLFDINCEVSMERYMKCGFGVCGSCCVDDMGIRICQEGPVFNKEIAKVIPEFSKYHRDGTGKKIKI